MFQKRRFSARGSNLTACSFCGKSHREVRKLIAGPNVYICDECISFCAAIIQKEDALDMPEVGSSFLGGLKCAANEQADWLQQLVADGHLTETIAEERRQRLRTWIDSLARPEA